MIRHNKELFDYIAEISRPGALQHFTACSFAPGAHILTEGKKVFSVYIIKSGFVKCYFHTENGGTFIQEFFGEGELFGEIELLDDTASYCTVEAIAQVDLYKISKQDFLLLLEKDAKLNRLFIKTLITKLKYKASRHSYNQLHTIPEKLDRLKSRMPDLTEVIPKQDIADYLGITLRALNRAIKGMTGAV